MIDATPYERWISDYVETLNKQRMQEIQKGVSELIRAAIVFSSRMYSSGEYTLFYGGDAEWQLAQSSASKHRLIRANEQVGLLRAGKSVNVIFTTGAFLPLPEVVMELSRRGIPTIGFGFCSNILKYDPQTNSLDALNVFLALLAEMYIQRQNGLVLDQ